MNQRESRALVHAKNVRPAQVAQRVAGVVRQSRWLVFGSALLVTTGCRKPSDQPLKEQAHAAEANEQKNETDPAAGQEPHAGQNHQEHGGHAHRAEGPSDLDRPVEELFGAKCEHGTATHACDECRYEVGVVKASASLFDGGLLSMAKVENRRRELPLSLTGEIEFDERRIAHVSSQAEGIIRKVHVTLGDRVKRGQALVEIDSVMVGDAQTELLEAQGILELARRNFERVEALRQEGIASEKEFLFAKREVEAAEIRSHAARGKLARLGAGSAGGLSSAGGRMVLRSPSEGAVLAMHAVPGEVAKSEESLLTVGDNATLWLWGDLYERDFAAVAAAQAQRPLAATVTVKAYPGVEFPGTVDFVSPSMSRASRTVKLRIALPNADGRLLAGMFTRVKLHVPGGEAALGVPRQAVLQDEGRSFV
ncbi:MAG: efflux RND transporter periplasmic adaptor subunit [Polyangiaceae bacterium]|nr:efflux RND transporter periplasmic adaptor subunit [Polyangiaceae bacterium]